MNLLQKKLYAIRYLCKAKESSAYTLYANQAGLSSLVLLFAIVLGVFIIWEFSEYIHLFTNPPAITTGSGVSGGTNKTICLTGEQDNCNDSNDQFIFTN